MLEVIFFWAHSEGCANEVSSGESDKKSVPIIYFSNIFTRVKKFVLSTLKTLIATLFLVENQPVDIKVECDLIRSMLLLLQYKNVDSLNKFQFMKYLHYLRSYRMSCQLLGSELTIDAINAGSQ